MSRFLYARAFELLRSGEPSSIKDALAMLRKEVEAHPEDMKALFEYAGAYDFLGREKDALPHYLKIFEQGHGCLPVDDQPRLYVQLGSTLRNLNSLPESQSILQEGMKYFPKYKALRAFLALTEYSMGNHTQAIQFLMEIALDGATDSSLIDYSRALGWYAGQLGSQK